MKKIKNLGAIIGIIMILQIIIPALSSISNAVTYDYTINLSDLSNYTTYTTVEELENAKQNGELPTGIYITKFLYDGAGAYKTYDLDDFAESGNDMTVSELSKTVVNINTTGNIELKGTLTGGMIAVNTNGKKGEINLYLNGVNIDTKDSDDKGKKIPAIYVYNKDVNYTDCKVTIKTVEGTKNYIEGGNLKKVSLVSTEDYENYASKYSGTAATNYANYSNYYKVYTQDQINNVLFAKVEASSEDLADGDPYYFYKGAGAISSDIDLYFEGNGYLSVISKNKEGIETKGNLEFAGGTGDYYVFSEDDCLNTTTKSSNSNSARNDLTIDVNSLTAIVDAGEDSSEGDAIDSNGHLTINGGTVIAVAHPGQDAGLDSESGTYINGGTVVATGDMLDAIAEESKQNYVVFNFSGKQSADTLITLLDSSDSAVMAYKTDRTYANLVYSSPKLTDGTYTLYKGGSIEGTETNGFYTEITSYTKGTQQGYSQAGTQGGMAGGQMGMGGKIAGGERPDENSGQMPSGAKPDENGAEMQNGNNTNENGVEMQNRGKNRTNGEMQSNEKQGRNMDETQDGERPAMPDDMQQNGKQGETNATSSNKEFKISGISNTFSGVGDYADGTVADGTVANTILPYAGIGSAVLIIVVAGIAASVYFYKKAKQ